MKKILQILEKKIVIRSRFDLAHHNVVVEILHLWGEYDPRMLKRIQFSSPYPFSMVNPLRNRLFEENYRLEQLSDVLEEWSGICSEWDYDKQFDAVIMYGRSQYDKRVPMAHPEMLQILACVFQAISDERSRKSKSRNRTVSHDAPLQGLHSRLASFIHEQNLKMGPIGIKPISPQSF